MTKSRKPLILITNDDGYSAKGINELIKGLKGLGELVVLAPDGPRSGMASAITSLVPIKYKLIRQEEDLRVYACTGTPVDCVKLAINVLLDRTPERWVLRRKAVYSVYLPLVFLYSTSAKMRTSRNVAV